MTVAEQYREIYRKVEAQLEHAAVEASNDNPRQAKWHLEKAQEVLAVELAMLSVYKKEPKLR